MFGLRHCAAFYDNILVKQLSCHLIFGICQTLGVKRRPNSASHLAAKLAASSQCHAAKNSGRFDAGFA